MSSDPRAALDELVAAFTAHLEAALAAPDPEADAVLDAGAALADAFDSYDEALYDATGVDTPFDLVDDDEDLDDDGDLDDELEDDDDDLDTDLDDDLDDDDGGLDDDDGDDDLDGDLDEEEDDEEEDDDDEEDVDEDD